MRWKELGLFVVGGLACFFIVLGLFSVISSSDQPQRDAIQPLTKAAYEDVFSAGKLNSTYISPHDVVGDRVWYSASDTNIERINATVFEVSRDIGEINERDLDAAWNLYNTSFEHAKEENWFNASKARDDGFLPRRAVPRSARHWPNFNNSYLSDTGSADPRNPHSLMFYELPGTDEKILAGLMFQEKLGVFSHGEQVGGPITTWHFHKMGTINLEEDLRKTLQGIPSINSSETLFAPYPLNGSIEELVEGNDRGVAMMHVWFVKHPEGPFGTSMVLDEPTRPQKMSKSEFVKYANKSHQRRLERFRYSASE